jgi:putative ABC transport system permease protein
VRAALRGAWRSVRRNTGRSLLIIALIALPVAGMTVVDGLVRTVNDRDAKADLILGAADARIDPVWSFAAIDTGALPPGSRLVPANLGLRSGAVRLTFDGRVVRRDVQAVPLGDPLVAHRARLVSGRLPRTPTEVLLTEPLAGQLGLLDEDGDLRPDAAVTVADGLRDGPRVTVTGLAVEPHCLSCADVVTRMDSVLDRHLVEGGGGADAYLVDLPDGTDVAALARNWPVSTSYLTTRDNLRATTATESRIDLVSEPATLFAGLGLIAIMVAVGAAFAVGARQQARELGLVAVNGGTAKQVRGLVLAQGLVLGVLGAATGLVVGAATAVLGVPLWQDVTDQLFENLRFGWLELTAAALVGVFASVVSAILPAFGIARLHPVDALSGQFRAAAPRGRHRLSWLGAGLAVVGGATAFVIGLRGRHQLAAHDHAWEHLKSPLPSPVDQTLIVAGTLAGTVVAIAGLVLLMPALLAAIGGLGRGLPVFGRLAVRDAVRHRHRTVAVGAAIMVTVAGSIVAAFVFTARVATEPKTLPDNTVRVTIDGMGMADGPKSLRLQSDLLESRLRASAPGARAEEVQYLSADESGTGEISLVQPSTRGGPCVVDFDTSLTVGTPELITLATGRPPDAATKAALADGKVVVFEDCMAGADGTTVLMGPGIGHRSGPANTMPAYRATAAPGSKDYYLPKAFVSPETAAKRGWRAFAYSVVVSYPGPDDLAGVRTAVDESGTFLTTSTSVTTKVTSLYLILAGVAALVALLGAGVAVALSASEGGADMATLSALGARPWHRRLLSGTQALVVTVLGTLAGVALGVCAGVAAVPAAGMHILAVPWQQLWLTVLAVPLLASLVAVVCTPSRLPMVGRRTS